MMNIKLMKKLYVKDPNEVKYQYLIKNIKKAVLKSMTIKKLLSYIQIISRMSIKILKSRTKIGNIKY